MIKRISSDIDSKNNLELCWYVYQALKKIKKIKSIEITPSYSKGYHLIVLNSHPYKQKQIYRLRKKIGDDIRRIEIDKIRRIKDTLFNSKKYLK
jgi:predicted phosphatase